MNPSVIAIGTASPGNSARSIKIGVKPNQPDRATSMSTVPGGFTLIRSFFRTMS